MQAIEVRKSKNKKKLDPQVLEQGSIFSLSGLKFETEDGIKTFSEFYPQIDLKGIKYGIVLSQDCDLFRNDQRSIEISHISISLLEPFSKMFNDLQKSSTEKFFHDPGVGKIFINQDGLDDRVKRDLERVLNNNHPFLYFISLGRKTDVKSKDYFLVNVSKMVPLKTLHYDSILNKVCYKLKPEFANKLGWKIATYFGRVGTPDYTAIQLKKIAKELFSSINKTKGDFIPLSADGFKKAKIIQPNMSKDKIIKIIHELNTDSKFQPQSD